MERRKFLKIMSGGIIVAAGTGVGGFLATRTPTKALKPWKQAGSGYTDARKRALSFAILAPNPHNRQPWKIDLSQNNEITIFPDLERMLPHTDPMNRQIVIGFGCFLEVLRMAAAQDGYEAIITAFPEGSDVSMLDERPVARVQLKKSFNVNPDPLFVQVPARRSLKEPFDLERTVSSETLEKLVAITNAQSKIGTTNREIDIEKLRKLTTDCLFAEIETDHTYKESVDLFRIGKREIEKNPDGIDFSGPFFESLALMGQFSREVAMDRESSGYKQGIEAVLTNTRTAMGYVWLVTNENSREAQLIAGRDWVRINLAATALGLGTQPLSQALQEYPEVRNWYDEVHAMITPKGGTIQMLARLGYGVTVPPSPRWELEQKLI